MKSPLPEQQESQADRRGWVSLRAIFSMKGLVIGALIVFAMGVTWYYTFRSALDDLETSGRQRLVIHEAGLRTSVARFHYLPSVLARDKDVLALLRAPENAQLVALINAKLQFVSEASGVAAVYVLDPDGIARAAGNWDSPNTFVGSSYAYRPYLLDALRVGSARYFGIGTTTGLPGLFFAEAVRDSDGRALGVVVVKVDMEHLQSEWGHAGEHILVADDVGVVFLASQPDWKYRPFRPLADDVKARLRSARQYGDSDLRPLIAAVSETRTNGGEVVVLDGMGLQSHGVLQAVRMEDFG